MMDFSDALYAARNGQAIARNGWNGRGMYVYFVAGGIYPSKTKVATEQFGLEVPYRSYLAMKTADDEVVPWVASQTDLLAEDWEIIGETK